MKSDWEEICPNTYWKPRAGLVFESLVRPGSWCGQVIGEAVRHYGTKEAAMQALDAADKTEESSPLDHPGFGKTFCAEINKAYTDDTPNFRLIGLTGPARSGKDTVADVLEDHGFARYALATPLKQGLRAMFGLTKEHTDGALKEKPIPFLGGVTPRKLMQTLGTEWARHNIDDDVWLWLADEERQFVQGRGYPGLVVTDIRFENEARFIRDRGGEVWHIRRSDVEAVSEHVSENGVAYKHPDRFVFNDDTLDELRRLVEGML